MNQDIINQIQSKIRQLQDEITFYNNINEIATNGWTSDTTPLTNEIAQLTTDKTDLEAKVESLINITDMIEVNVEPTKVTI